jgi:hypothetical protein
MTDDSFRTVVHVDETLTANVCESGTIVTMNAFDKLIFECALAHSRVLGDSLRDTIAHSLSRIALHFGARYALLVRDGRDSSHPNVVAEFKEPAATTFKERLRRATPQTIELVTHYLRTTHVITQAEFSDDTLALLLTPYPNGSYVTASVVTSFGSLALVFGGVDEQRNESLYRPQLELILRLFDSAVTRDDTEQQITREHQCAKRATFVVRLVSSYTHDFNDILNSINCVTDAALLDVSQNSQTHIDIDEIKRATQRGSRLTNQLHDFAESASMSVRPCDLKQVVASFIPSLNRLLGPETRLELSSDSSSVGTYIAPELLELYLSDFAWHVKPQLADGGYLILRTAQQTVEHTRTSPEPGGSRNMAELWLTPFRNGGIPVSFAPRTLERLSLIAPLLGGIVFVPESRSTTVVIRLPQELNADDYDASEFPST